MTRPRERRPKPEPVSAEEEAEIEAKYQHLWRLLRRYAARKKARDVDSDGSDAPRLPGSCQAEPD